MTETGRYGTINDLAAAERIERSHLGKMLRLTLLRLTSSRRYSTGYGSR